MNPHSDISIDPLNGQHPCVDIVTMWIQEEWGKADGRSLEETKERILRRDNCPPALVATTNRNVVGLVSFTNFELASSGTDEIWIDALYVDQEFRGKGIAKLLVNHAEKLASEATETLYAYTDVPHFYEKLGWVVFTKKDASGNTVVRKGIG